MKWVLLILLCCVTLSASDSPQIIVYVDRINPKQKEHVISGKEVLGFSCTSLTTGDECFVLSR
jgi:hypothetical protein